MKIDCDVARDLMPLVIDEVASDSSVNLVKEHITECEACSNYWAGMSSALPKAKKTAEAGRMLRQLRKVQKMRVLVIAFIGLIVGCSLVWGGFAVRDKLQTEPAVPANLQYYDYRLAKIDDEHVAIIEVKNELPYTTTGWNISYETNGEASICYLSMEVPWLKSEESQEPWTYYWETWIIKDGRILSPDHEKPLIEIRKGTTSNYQTLWKMGDTIAEASPEFQQYLMLRDAWEALETVVIDGVAEFVDHDAAWRLQQEMGTLRDNAPELQTNIVK